MIYVSFVADDTERVLNIFDPEKSNNEYKKYIDGVVLLFQPEYSEKIETVKHEINLHVKKVKAHEIKLVDCDDLQEVFDKLSSKIRKLNEEDDFLNREKLINISAGTRSMNISWVLLNQSGVLRNSKLVQYNTKKSSYKEVEFNKIEGFPTIQKIQEWERKYSLLAKTTETDFIGQSRSMLEVKDLIEKYAPTDYPVLIVGETGSGKEETAKQIHLGSKRNKKEMVTYNCAAITPSLIVSELFGYKKGAFSGAANDTDGIFKTANEKTLFLDEIGDLPLDAQAAVLRVLDKQEIQPVGPKSEKPEKVDVRIIAATNKDIKQMIEKKEFREDLFFRLNTLSINLPPLRNREDDIDLLITKILTDLGGECTISTEAREMLRQYDWPGNVRELKNVLIRGKVLSERNNIQTHNLFFDLRRVGNFSISTPSEIKENSGTKDEALKSLYDNALKDNNMNAAAAARMIKMKPPAFQKALRKWKQNPKEVEDYPHIYKWLFKRK